MCTVRHVWRDAPRWISSVVAARVDPIPSRDSRLCVPRPCSAFPSHHRSHTLSLSAALSGSFACASPVRPIEICVTRLYPQRDKFGTFIHSVFTGRSCMNRQTPYVCLHVRPLREACTRIWLGVCGWCGVQCAPCVLVCNTNSNTGNSEQVQESWHGIYGNYAIKSWATWGEYALIQHSLLISLL